MLSQSESDKFGLIKFKAMLVYIPSDLSAGKDSD